MATTDRATPVANPARASDSQSPSVRTLLVLMALLLGIIAGLVGGILAVATGTALAAAFATGGMAFAGAVSLVLAIEKSLGSL